MLKENNKVRKISNNQSTCIVCNLCLGTYVVGAKIPFSDKKNQFATGQLFPESIYSLKLKKFCKKIKTLTFIYRKTSNKACPLIIPAF